MQRNKVLSLAGLAARARKIASGEDMVENSIRSGEVRLVIVAEDASANTRKKFSDKCSYYQVPILFVGTKEEVGKAIGKEFRASIAVLDEGFAKAMLDAEGQRQKKEECVCQK